MNDLWQMVSTVTGQLIAKNETIATAESCTGGMLASILTELPGSSAWFDCGFVTYSNAAKQRMLNIASELIEQHGAVSSLVAKAMALGALANSSAGIALAITGIAGPSGGSAAKPVGTVYFAVTLSSGYFVCEQKCFSNQARAVIRENACLHALGMLNALL